MLSSGDEQLPDPRPVDDVRRLHARCKVLPRRRAAVAVEQDRAEHDRDERDRARNPLGARRAR